MEDGISIIIPTFNGGEVFSRSLEKIGGQIYPGPVQLIVIDSGSDDGTPEVAQRAGALVRGIDRRQFHHARTRNEALPLARFDRVVYIVQDAVPCGRTWLADLEKALMENDVAAVYAEQVPHRDAAPYARFETASIQYGRGQEPVVHALESREQFLQMPYHEAYRTIGLDNICAIYRKDLLLETPFPDVDFAEDLAWAFKSLLMGHRIMYDPRIQVRHSHDRSPRYAFRRQIVNSYWCAKITGRVERDLSFVRLTDLMLLTRMVERSVALQRAGIVGHGRDSFPGITSRLSGKFPLITRMRAFMDERLSPFPRSRSRVLERLAHEVDGQIQYIFNHIRENYPVPDEASLSDLLELATANVLGRLFGEVYASRVLKGPMDRRLEAFIKPFMRGV